MTSPLVDKIVEKGHLFQTGKEVTIPAIRHEAKAQYYGSRFQQDIEPAGLYFQFDSDPNPNPPEGITKFKITLKNPLLLLWNSKDGGYDENSWKAFLFNKYKKKGKSLSSALMKDGYDSVVTIDRKYNVTSEIVKLASKMTSFKDFITEESLQEADPLKDKAARQEAVKFWNILYRKLKAVLVDAINKKQDLTDDPVDQREMERWLNNRGLRFKRYVDHEGKKLPVLILSPKDLGIDTYSDLQIILAPKTPGIGGAFSASPSLAQDYHKLILYSLNDNFAENVKEDDENVSKTYQALLSIDWPFHANIDLQNDVGPTFVHEIIHYFDFKRSKGQWFKHAKSGESLAKGDVKGYFNNPVEFNAHTQDILAILEKFYTRDFLAGMRQNITQFKQMIKAGANPEEIQNIREKMDFYDMKISNYLGQPRTAFDTIWMHFENSKNEFIKNLTEENKRKLKARIYQWYIAVLLPKMKMSKKQVDDFVGTLQTNEETLNEVNYEEMFKDNDKEQDAYYGLVNKFLPIVKKTLKKQDRIVWFLRIVRLFVIALDYKKSKEERQQLIKKDIELFQKKSQDTAGWHNIQGNLLQLIKDTPEGESTHPDLINKAKRILNDWLTSIEHYIAQSIPKVDSFVFQYQSPSQLRDQLSEIEDEYQKQFSHLIPADEEEEAEQEVVIEFPDKFRWVNLNKSYCEKEGNAMGHCGNVEGKSRTSDRILSLREPKKVGKNLYWEPHTTFILMQGGILGEMKGKSNEKPEKKYHKYIIPLLKKKDLIKGMNSSWGYMPESNFKLSDLTDEEQKQVYESNPLLFEFADLLRIKAPKELLDEKQAAMAATAEKGMPELTEKSKNYIFLRKYKKLGDAIQNHFTSDVWKFYQNLENIDSYDYDVPSPDDKEMKDDLAFISDETEEKAAKYYEIVDDNDEYDREELFDKMLEDEDLRDGIRMQYEDYYRSSIQTQYEKQLIDMMGDTEFVTGIDTGSGNASVGLHFVYEGPDGEWREIHPQSPRSGSLLYGDIPVYAVLRKHSFSPLAAKELANVSNIPLDALVSNIEPEFNGSRRGYDIYPEIKDYKAFHKDIDSIVRQHVSKPYKDPRQTELQLAQVDWNLSENEEWKDPEYFDFGFIDNNGKNINGPETQNDLDDDKILSHGKLAYILNLGDIQDALNKGYIRWAITKKRELIIEFHLDTGFKKEILDKKDLYKIINRIINLIKDNAKDVKKVTLDASVFNPDNINMRNTYSFFNLAPNVAIRKLTDLLTITEEQKLLSKDEISDLVRKSNGIPHSPNQKAALDAINNLNVDQLKQLLDAKKFNVLMKQMIKLRLKKIESNPSQFKKYLTELHYTDLFGKQFKEFEIKYENNTDKDMFVQFTNHAPDVLEKNPYAGNYTGHDDPVGVYAYPLSYVINNPAKIYYGSGAKYIRVLRAKDPSDKRLYLQKITMNQAIDLLDKLYDNNGEDAYAEAEQDIIAADYNQNPGNVLWWAIQHDVLSPLWGTLNVIEKNRKILDNKIQSQRLAKIGKTTVIDLAQSEKDAVINPAEPQQGLFLTRHNFDIEDIFVLRSQGDSETMIRGDYKKEDIARQIKKLAGMIAKKFDVEIQDFFKEQLKDSWFASFSDKDFVHIEYTRPSASKANPEYDSSTFNVVGRIGGKTVGYNSKPSDAMYEIVDILFKTAKAEK
jgi:hypothetical protein